VGPVLGGVAAALLYTQVLEAKPVPKVNEASEKYRTHADEREVRVRLISAWSEESFY